MFNVRALAAQQANNECPLWTKAPEGGASLLRLVSKESLDGKRLQQGPVSIRYSSGFHNVWGSITLDLRKAQPKIIAIHAFSYRANDRASAGRLVN